MAKFVYLHFTLILVVFLQSKSFISAHPRLYDELHLDEFCLLLNNQTGICKYVETCQSAIQSLHLHQSPGVSCGFDGSKPIVCCENPVPKENSTSTKPVVTSTERNKVVNETGGINNNKWLSTSQKKCQQYANYVFTNESSPALIPGIQYVILNGCKVNGTFAAGSVESGEFPHLVSIGYSNIQNPVYACTGALISENYVLTTASCTSTPYGFPLKVRLGTTIKQDYYYQLPEIQYIRVENFIKHPDYNYATKENDIALIKLADPVVINALTRPACLPEEKQLNDVIAVGYGSLGNYGKFGEDIEEDVLILTATRERCPKRVSIRNHSTLNWCGKFKNTTRRNPCVLDEGAPLQIVNESPYCTFSIVGLVSSWERCDPTKPMIITDVFKYVKWIEDNIWY